MPMTPEQQDIIKSTVPILEAGGVALTTHFYNKMFTEHKDAKVTRTLFNQSHQGSQEQPKALAYSVLCVARHVHTIGELLASPEGKHLINTIVTKHVAMNILPEHYPIVGQCLLESIAEVLGPDVATQTVIDAYAALYGVLADLLIGLEKDQYEVLATTPGGWRGARDFTIIGKRNANAEGSAVTYTLQTADKNEVMDFKAGQYLTLRLEDEPKINTTRNYSLSAPRQKDEAGVYNIVEFTTQIQGLATNYLNDDLKVGSTLKVHPITGEFTLREDNDAEQVVLIAAGSGITPFIPMATAAKAAGKKVTLVHISHNAQKAILTDAVAKLDGVDVITYYTETEGKLYSTPDTPSEALVALLQKAISADVKPGAVYVVGPRAFMLNVQFVMTQKFPQLDVDQGINYEAFGPHPSLDLLATKQRAAAQ